MRQITALLEWCLQLILETAVEREKDVHQELVQTFVIRLRFPGLFDGDQFLLKQLVDKSYYIWHQAGHPNCRRIVAPD